MSKLVTIPMHSHRSLLQGPELILLKLYHIRWNVVRLETLTELLPDKHCWGAHTAKTLTSPVLRPGAGQTHIAPSHGHCTVQAQRAAEAQRLQDMFSFMASLQALLGVVVPQSLLAPVVAPSPPIETPVSIYGCLFI